MSEISVQQTKPNLIQLLRKGAPTVLVLALMAGGWLAIHEINTAGLADSAGDVAAIEDTSADMLTLPEAKLHAAGFETVPAQPQRVQHVHSVPGRIGYDETMHVDVKAPMDGILAEVLVTPGESVEMGQLLAVLRSPEIGQARAEILKRQKELEISQQVLQRELTLSQNLLALSKLLDGGASLDAIEAALTDRSLGSYRQQLLSSYSKLLLSTELLAKIQPLASSGAIPGRTIREREAECEIAETEFKTARDQAAFAAQQAKLQAEARVAESDRQLNLAWQAVETLLGYKENREETNLSDAEALSRLEVRAPLAGTVEARVFARSERVTRGDSLIILANTDSLSVSASIRDSDWSAVSLPRGTSISVIVPALDDRRFDAKVRYLGREVRADTNSVPLIASISNYEGLLRPGMFVRVIVPIGEARTALSVKPESVVQHENQQFVFVDMTGGTFKKVDVSTGEASEDWIEITDGLKAGQAVVTNGAFLLKSELLLQGESE